MRARRRAFVVLGNALALATVAAALLDLGDVAIVPGIAASFCCAMFFGAVLVPAGPMDDQEARVRDGAHRRSYLAASFLVMPAALAAAALVGQRDGVQVVWAFVAACLLFWGLPYSLIAWSMPDLSSTGVAQEDPAVVKASVLFES
jgi:hypothetical protein